MTVKADNNFELKNVSVNKQFPSNMLKNVGMIFKLINLKICLVFSRIK